MATRRATRLIAALVGSVAMAIVATGCLVPDPKPADLLAQPQPLRTPAATGVPYGSDPAQVLDIYLPTVPSTGLRPVMVYIHGGGWAGGSRETVRCGPKPGGGNYDCLAAMLSQVDRGWVVVSIDYRLTPTHRWPAQIQDVKRAIKWLRDASAFLSIDPNRIVTSGASAGGHLATMAATTDGLWEPAAGYETNLRGYVNMTGPTDFPAWYAWDVQTPDWAPVVGMMTGLFGCDPSTPACTVAMAAASPINYVDEGDPRGYFVCGEEDILVPCSLHQSMYLALVEEDATPADYSDALLDVVNANGVIEGADHVPDYQMNMTVVRQYLDQVTAP